MNVALGLLALVAAFLAGRASTRYPCPHPWTLNLSPGRVWLECPLCGLESPGWNLTIAPPPPQPRPQPRGITWPTMILH